MPGPFCFLRYFSGCMRAAETGNGTLSLDKPHQTALYWFRRALRLDDNTGLARALETARSVVPVFILDPSLLTSPTTGAARTRFLFDSLAALDEALRERGSRLVVRRGKPVEELERLVEETGATALVFGREYEPFGRARDQAVETAMRCRGVAVEQADDHLLVEPGQVCTRAGTPYTVFTPFRRVWREQPVAAPIDAPARIPSPARIGSEPLPASPAKAGVVSGEPLQEPRVRGGEVEAARWLDTFVESCLGTYDADRDVPGVEGTSRLSAYLRSGVVSARRVFARVRERRAASGADGRAGADTFLSELAWRDFYYQILWHFPHVEVGAFRQELNDLDWENDDAHFAAWTEGRTGYPIVDAAQRQLAREAWMHNRARMITASFLTKDLLIDWRWGETLFMQRLVDGDLASNNGGWQWAASTGTDAQPYFRIFNPVSQGEKFDPAGAYVKRWVPELARVPAKYVHRPWELTPAEQEAVGCVLGRDYPHRIVDHAAQRDKALRLYRRRKEDK